MSLKGIVVPKPKWYKGATSLARPRHIAKTGVREGLRPEERKKLKRAGFTQGPAGPVAQGASPAVMPTCNGSVNRCWPLANAHALARSQFSTRAFPLAAFTLTGRVRSRPPEKL